MTHDGVDTVEAIPLIAKHDDQDRGDDDDDREAFALKHSDVDHFSSPSTATRRSLSTLLVASAFLVSVLSLAWNGYTFAAAVFASPASSPRVPNALTVDSLRRPSQYLGMERVPGYRAVQRPHTPSPAGSSTTPVLAPGAPTALARVNSRFPDVVFDRDRWVFLTEDDHTLLEFPVPPAAHRCAFVATFPPRSALGLESPTTLLTLELPSSSPPTPNPPIPVVLTLLAPLPAFSLASPSSSTSLSWNHRPAPSTRLGTLTAAFDTNSTSPSFPCTGGASVLVEAGCEGAGCRVEYAYPDLSKPVGPPGRQRPPRSVGITLVAV